MFIWTGCPRLLLSLGYSCSGSVRALCLRAVPILVLWASSKLVALWLNRPPGPVRNEVSQKDENFLRVPRCVHGDISPNSATKSIIWLIPDNVQEEPLKVAPRVSPTNVGLLLNARQVACEFGYLTVPEFAAQSFTHACDYREDCHAIKDIFSTGTTPRPWNRSLHYLFLRWIAGILWHHFGRCNRDVPSACGGQ